MHLGFSKFCKLKNCYYFSKYIVHCALGKCQFWCLSNATTKTTCMFSKIFLKNWEFENNSLKLSLRHKDLCSCISRIRPCIVENSPKYGCRACTVIREVRVVSQQSQLVSANLSNSQFIYELLELFCHFCVYWSA